MQGESVLHFHVTWISEQAVITSRHARHVSCMTHAYHTYSALIVS